MYTFPFKEKPSIWKCKWTRIIKLWTLIVGIELSFKVYLILLLRVEKKLFKIAFMALINFSTKKPFY